MSSPAPGGAAGRGATKRTADPQAILGAGSRAYVWLRDALRVYGTVVTLVQLVPAAVALFVVFLSPTAWLSATLRRWVGVGAVVGTLAGMLLLARVAGPRTLVEWVRDGRARSTRLAGLAWWGLGLATLSAVAFRFHLSVVDVALVESLPFLTGVFDFYLGGGAAAARLYNALAAVLAGLTLAGIVAGAPAGVMRWRERRIARRNLLEDGGALVAIDLAMKSLAEAKDALEASRTSIVAMADELDDLRAAAERASRAAAEAAEAAEAAALTSAAAQPNLPDPPAGVGRSPR